MFCFLLCILVSAVSADQPWPNLKTTFGAFNSQPRTEKEAIESGLSRISSVDVCAGKHLGFAYGNQSEPSIVLLFDEAGYIAGVQSVLLKSAVNLTYYDVPNIPAYTKGTYFGKEAWFTTAYFVDPEVICNGGRTKDQWKAQGTGDRLWIQVGEFPPHHHHHHHHHHQNRHPRMKKHIETPDNFVKIPLTQAEADGKDNWHKHFCFRAMGTHYIELNYKIDQDCNSVLPLQILYDQGVLTGFVWLHIANLPGERWEKVTELAIKMIIDRPAQCVLDSIQTPGIVSMHHYFFDNPWLIKCN